MLNEQLKKILDPFEFQLADEGKLLTCSACLSDTTYTIRRLCGPCFLFGNNARPSDPRTPRISTQAEEMQ